MKEKELRKSLMAKSKEQLVELYLQKKFDYELLEALAREGLVLKGKKGG